MNMNGDITSYFGSEEYFTNYIDNTVKKENGDHLTLYRIHFSMATYVLETFGDKESFKILKNLNAVCEKYSKRLALEGGL